LYQTSEIFFWNNNSCYFSKYNFFLIACRFTEFLPRMFSVMSLQRIFSSTTIIVGLFISVDYGLCDEFRCRGREVSSHTAAIRGSWGARAVWTFVYVGSLAAFAMFFTMLERHYTTGVIYHRHSCANRSLFAHNTHGISDDISARFLLNSVSKELLILTLIRKDWRSRIFIKYLRNTSSQEKV